MREKKFEGSEVERMSMKIADDESREEEERENAWLFLELFRVIEKGELDLDNYKKVRSKLWMDIPTLLKPE